MSYWLRCAPKRPQRLHFCAAIPVFLSLGLLNFKNFLAIVGLFFNCFNTLFQSLAVMLFYDLCLKCFLHIIYNFSRRNMLLSRNRPWLYFAFLNPYSRTLKNNSNIKPSYSYFTRIFHSRNIYVFRNSKRKIIFIYLTYFKFVVYRSKKFSKNIYSIFISKSYTCAKFHLRPYSKSRNSCSGSRFSNLSFFLAN